MEIAVTVLDPTGTFGDGGGLSMSFPKAIVSDEDKVIWALWHNGRDQCFCNLQLLTGLSEEELRDAIRKLKDRDRVRIVRLPFSDELQLNRVVLR